MTALVALSAATLAAIRAGASDDASQLALWIWIGVESVVASAALLRRM